MCDEQRYTEGVCRESLASGVAKDYVLADGLSNPDRLLPAIHTHLPALTGRTLALRWLCAGPTSETSAQHRNSVNLVSIVSPGT